MSEQRKPNETTYTNGFGLDIPIEFHLADHCNLNCRRCAHFSPVAEPRFATMDEVVAAMKTIRTIMPRRVNLLGGEPLLHPDIEGVIRHIGDNMPEGITTYLVTNGILLKTMSEEFWDMIKRYGFSISITVYPTKINYSELIDLAVSKGVSLSGIYNPRLKFKAIRLTEDRRYDQGRTFSACKVKCIQIRDERLYPCAYSAYVDHINKRFGTGISHGAGDWLSIDEIRNGKDVEKWMLEPKPFCAHCNSGIESSLRWERSDDHDVDEWIEA